VCGTDREIARFDYGTPPAGSPYLVMGHESLGQVTEVGAAVKAVRPGDLVVTMVRRPCDRPDCPACRIGRQDFCVTGRFTERGINGRHGFMTEAVVDDERYLVAVPRALADVGVLIEPLTIAEKAFIQVGDVQDRLPWLGEDRGQEAAHRAVVLGAGPVGMLGAMALRVRGSEVWVYSRDPSSSDKARWVEAIGGRYLSSTETSLDELAAQVGNIDLVYEATGASQLSFQALAVLGVNGVFVFTGVPGRKAPIEVDADLLMRNLVLRNQLVYGTVNAGPDAFQAAIQDLAELDRRWPAQLRALITGRHPPEVFEELLLGPATGIKRVIHFAEAR
jgi:threonine dehydrogenase-like Zn-dependent dehydrogenase